MDKNLEQSNTSASAENSGTSQVGGGETKKVPQDIFAESANPNVRLTPVDTNVTASASEVPRITLSDSSSVSSKPAISQKRPVKEKRHVGKVTILMGVAIGVIVIFVISYLAFQFLRSEVVVETTNEVIETITDNKPVVLPTTDTPQDVVEIAVDTDKDGLTDEREIELGLDINNADSDGDGLSDKDEVDIYSTDPFNLDSDGDGFVDGAEVSQGYDPSGPGRLNDINRQNL